MTDDDIRRIIATSCAARGCTCAPDITITTEGELLVAASVAHADDCAAVAPEPNWN